MTVLTVVGASALSMVACRERFPPEMRSSLSGHTIVQQHNRNVRRRLKILDAELLLLLSYSAPHRTLLVLCLVIPVSTCRRSLACSAISSIGTGKLKRQIRRAVVEILKRKGYVAFFGCRRHVLEKRAGVGASRHRRGGGEGLWTGLA